MIRFSYFILLFFVACADTKPVVNQDTEIKHRYAVFYSSTVVDTFELVSKYPISLQVKMGATKIYEITPDGGVGKFSCLCPVKILKPDTLKLNDSIRIENCK